MMIIKRIQLLLFCFISLGSHLLFPATLVTNTLKEIDGCEGRINLELIRVWGADDTQDPHQFFKIPQDIKIHGDLVYIADAGQHVISVFDRSGRYVRTIGGRGQGPGDLLTPNSMVFDERDNR